MDINIDFSFMNILILITLGTIWLSWMFYAWSKYNLSRRWKVYLFWTTACTGLFMLIVEPVINTGRDADNALLDFESENKDEEHLASDFPKKNMFTNFHDVLESLKIEPIDTLFINGNDINTQDFELLKDVHIHILEKKAIGRFTGLSVKNSFTNVPFRIFGTSTGIDTVQVIDSQNKIWPAIVDSTGAFELEIKINSSGLHQLSLIGLKDKDTIIEPVPVLVNDNPKWNMLVWSSYPSYDVNYHKNFWAKNGYGYALRQNISQNKVQTSFINMAKLSLTRINGQLLSRFNFFNIDVSSWNDLSNKDRAAVLEAVKYKGLTCIIRPQQEIIQARDLPYHNIGAQKEIYTDGDDKEERLIEYGFKGGQSWIPIDFNKIRMGVSHDVGVGKVVINLIEDTYPLILSGKDDYYSTIWAHYYSRLFRYLDKGTFYNIPFWNWENQEMDIDIQNYNQEVMEIYNNGSQKLPLIEVPGISGLYRSKCWPKAGWNEISTDLIDDSHFYYSFANDEWTMVKHKSLNKAAQIHNNAINNQTNNHFTKRPLPFWWAYILLLIGFGGLWLMERLD
jgi:hypothetical protein